MLAPIVLFVYNRPTHTKTVIEALKNNRFARDSDLIIFSDAPKDALAVESVSEVRGYIKSITGFKSIKIRERKINHGLAKSIIDGVTEVVGKYGKVIVLEDDLITSEFFLDFMNNALNKYENDKRVISVHGYVYPVLQELPQNFFIKGADCWGWATWKRGWGLFEQDGRKLLIELVNKKLTKEFDFNNSYPYTQMLKDQIAGKNNSWAIRWYASAFVSDKLTLYPGISLVKNIGFDNSGTHCGTGGEYDTILSTSAIPLQDITVEENVYAKKTIENFFASNQMSLSKKIIFKSKLLILISKFKKMYENFS